MSMNSGIISSRNGAVRVLQLDNPARKNALTLAMYTTLAAEIAAADNDPAVRVVVITGSESCFCSGNDLEGFIGQPLADDDHPIRRFMRALLSFSKPVIAAVEGPAIGIGTTLLLHCDLVYAGRSALFKLPFVQLGICPEFASSTVLPRLLGRQRAAELLLLGDAVDAQRAEALGLINGVVADGDALTEALQIAERLAAGPPRATRAAKRLLNRTSNSEIEAAIEAEFQVLVEAVEGAEIREALAAFRDKRAPDFSRCD